MRWVDGWPAVDPVRELTAAPPGSAPAGAAPAEPGVYRDDFDTTVLAPEWISPRHRPDGSWSLTARPGWLTLHATGATLDRAGATIVAVRQRHHDCRVSVRVDPGDGTAGLTIRIDEAHHYDLEVAAGTVRVIGRVGPFRQVFASRAVPDGPLVLTVATRTHDLYPPTVTSAAELAAGTALGVRAAGCDMITFGVAEPGGDAVLAELDGRYLSTEVAAGFTGRVVGMYVTAGSAAFDWFAYHPAG